MTACRICYRRPKDRYDRMANDAPTGLVFDELPSLRAFYLDNGIAGWDSTVVRDIELALDTLDLDLADNAYNRAIEGLSGEELDEYYETC